MLEIVLDSISPTYIKGVMKDNYLSFVMVISMFMCVVFMLKVFINHRIISIKLLLAWLVSGAVSIMFLANRENLDFIVTIDHQIILLITTETILIGFYIYEVVFSKSKLKRRTKHYGRNQWWVNIVSLAVSLSFCFAGNVLLYTVCMLIR